MKRPQKPGGVPAVGDGYTLLSIGITFALTLTGFALLGFWGDRKLGTMPLFTLVGTFAGMALAGFWVWTKVGRRPTDGPDDR